MELNVELLGNIEDHCLACLRKEELMEDLTETKGILATFKTTFNLEVSIDHGIPKYLCNSCYNKLYEAAEFLLQVENNIKYFRERRSSQKSVIPEVKQEESIQLEFKDEDGNEDDCYNSSNSESDSDNEPLIKFARKKTRKKVPFNSKLRKVPLKDVEEAMKKHQSRCNENANCIVCDFKGLSIRNLSCHMIFKHKEEKDRWCSRCNMLVEDLVNHRKTHTNKIWCKFCNKFVTRCHYMEHLKCHAGLAYHCEHCQKKFISQKALDEHMEQHKQSKPFRCRICQKSFKAFKSLENHLSLHGRYRCDKCEKNFEIPELLTSHLCTGRPSKKESLIVEGDPGKHSQSEQSSLDQLKDNTDNRLDYKAEEYMQEEDLNIEPERDIENYKPKVEMKEVESLTCHFCQRTYKTAYKLQKHIEGHMGIFLAKCRYCGKGFTSNSDLMNHERVHTKEKPFICNVCGKGFVSGATLRIHMKQHTGKPEECDLCHKRFCRKSELKLHLQKHRGERPFLCTDCGKSFAQKSHLTCHLTMHSEERPYSCKICDKSFKKKELLKHHMKLHGGEKRFKCTICFYECYKNYRLQQHMKMHEGKSDIKVNLCQLCGKGFSSITLLNSHMTNVHSVIV